MKFLRTRANVRGSVEVPSRSAGHDLAREIVRLGRAAWFRRTMLLASLLVLSLPAGVVSAADAVFQAAAAQVDITPPEGYPMAGYYHERLATGTQNPLHAKAVVFRQGDQQAAIVVCDLTGIAVDLTREVRRIASDATGIPPQNIVVSGTHSHTAPDYTKDLYQYLRNPDSPDAKQRYAARLIESVAAAVITAHKQLGPAKLAAGSAEQQVPIAFNRRFVMQDGSVRTWMNFSNPQVVRSAGPIDPEVGALLIKNSENQRPVAAVSNFALHLDTVGGTLWNADYPYYVERWVNQKFGDTVVSLFGLGCCGDINHVDPNRSERNKTDFIGQALAETVRSALESAQPLENPRLRVRTQVVQLPLRDVDAAGLERAKTLLVSAKNGSRVEFHDLVVAYRDVVIEQLRRGVKNLDLTELVGLGLTHTWAGVGDTLPAEVTTVALGSDLAIVCLPGEVFVDLGLAIKQASPFRQTMIFELSNCVETFYVPTRGAYAQGSYEVTNSMLAPGAGEMLVEAALATLREAANSLAESDATP